MSTSSWFIVLSSLVIFDFILGQFLGWLNSKNWKNEIPDEMKEFYPPEDYIKAKDYKQTNDRVGLVSSGISILLTLFVLYFGVFGWLDSLVVQWTESLFYQSALFFGVVFMASSLISLPFEWYGTFVIEKDFGFNKTSIKTFVLDKIKGALLAVVLGGGLLYGVLFVLEKFSSGYWYWLWIGISLIMLLLNMFYADIILPLFNKLKPLEEGDLKSSITAYAKNIGYPIKNIYVIDGSKRSTKANAFFSGLGPRKTIALYDTLIEKHETEELVAILAHEIGHYKKKHVFVSLILSILQLGLTLFLLEYFLTIPEIAYALGAERMSIHVGLIAFGIIFSPLGLITGVVMNVLSRKNEFEADAFAAETYGSEPLIRGLKKLSVDNLSNLYPHPWFVFVHYSHPPLLQRIKALRQLNKK